MQPKRLGPRPSRDWVQRCCSEDLPKKNRQVNNLNQNKNSYFANNSIVLHNNSNNHNANDDSYAIDNNTVRLRPMKWAVIRDQGQFGLSISL